MGRIEYSSNNSGGVWWLKDKDWDALTEAGWVVHYEHAWNDPSHGPHDWQQYFGGRKSPEEVEAYFAEYGGLRSHSHNYMTGSELVPVAWNGERNLGAKARSAAKETDDPDAAVAEFERVTNQNADDEGCNCCGPPHSFTYYDDEGKPAYFGSVITGRQRVWS